MHEMSPTAYAYGLWTTVFFNVLLVVFFTASFIRPKQKFEWKSMGTFIGFIAALFTEMYGFPLTIYLLTNWLGNRYPVIHPFSHSNGHLLLVVLGLSQSDVAMTVLHLVTNGIILFGFYLLYKGWILIYNAGEKELVTGGVYSYIRHPQYLGLFFITGGLLIQWPTLITVIMWPILMYAYYRLSMSEEKLLEEKFGEQFFKYKRSVPAFIPSLKRERLWQIT